MPHGDGSGAARRRSDCHLLPHSPDRRPAGREGHRHGRLRCSPDLIAMGSPTVLIGGMMAARMGDPTAHGGAIVLGFPMVMIS